MSDEANAPSNGASEVIEPVANTEVQADTAQATPDVSEPAKSPREAVERAFAKVQEPKAETQEVKAEPEKKPRNPNRAEDGKFTTAPKTDPTAKVGTAATAQPKTEQPAPIDASAPKIAAPQRFAKAAQDAWATTPEPVRQEVERALTELTQGIEKYKGEAEAFQPVKKYHDMAAQSGTTLERALDAYVGIETAWRSNPARGFVEVCRNMGVEPTQMLQAVAQGLQDAAATVPQRDSAEVTSLKNELSELKKTLEGFGKTFTETQQQTKQREAQASVEAFAKDHPHFDEVAESVAHMLETGFAKNLNDAYEKAIRLSPEVLAKIEQEKKPAVDPAQTREKAAKSITGSPQTGSIPDSRKPAGSAREALQGAFAQVGL